MFRRWSMAAAISVSALGQPVWGQDAGWSVRRETDRMTGESSATAEVISGSKALMVRCVSGIPVVMLVAGDLIGRSADGRDRAFAPAYRVDDHPASTVAWSHIQSGGALMGVDARDFVTAVKDGESTVLTRIVTWQNRTIDTEFNLRGSSGAISEALASCP